MLQYSIRQPDPTNQACKIQASNPHPHRHLPEKVVDLMVSASRREAAGGAAAADTFTAIAKAHRKQKNPHLTLHLCRAFEDTTGSPLVPSTPEGLVLLLDAMRPKTARYAVPSPGGGSGSPSERAPFGGEGGVEEVLRRFEEGGKVTMPAGLCGVSIF